MMAYANPLSNRNTPLIPIAGVSFGWIGSGFAGSVAEWYRQFHIVTIHAI